MRQPYAHLAAATMAPSVVRNEAQLHVLCVQTALLVETEELCVGLYHLNIIVSHLFILGVKCSVLNSHLRTLVHQCTHNVEVVVWPLCAIYYRTTLYCYKTAVSFHVVVGAYCSWVHIEVNTHHIALLPLAVDGEVAIVGELSIHGIAVHRDVVLWTQVVGKLV